MNLTKVERKWIKFVRNWRSRRRQMRYGFMAVSEAAVKWAVKLLWRLS